MSMNNLSWFWDLPTVPGHYLVCYGDVESFGNVGLFYIDRDEKNGKLYADVVSGFQHEKVNSSIEMYKDKYKFCRLEDMVSCESCGSEENITETMRGDFCDKCITRT